MRVSKTVQDRVNAKLKECIAMAESHYSITVKFPRVTYTLRGTTAGTANHGTYVVNFNSVLLMENEDKFIARTVPHELAHLIDHQLHPENFESYGISVTRNGRVRRNKRTVHGPTWKAIMAVIGAADATRCHTYDTTNAKTKKKAVHVWQCACGSHMHLGPVRHKKMLSGVSKYRQYGHARCGGYSYLGLEGSELQPMPLPKAADKSAPKKKAAKGKTKLAQCRALYNPNADRMTNIVLFVLEAGCTKAGAATYYNTIKKEQA